MACDDELLDVTSGNQDANQAATAVMGADMTYVSQSENGISSDIEHAAHIGVTTVETDGEYTLIKTENGDVLRIGPSHRARTAAFLKEVMPEIVSRQRTVISIGGASGSGKSEIGALVVEQLIEHGIDAILVPCDNYPIRPPLQNDAHRRELFKNFGPEALKNYLGTEQEILFSRLAEIVDDFITGKETVNLRKINMKTTEVTENIPHSVGNARVLVFEGTWSTKIRNVTFPVFLDSDFKNTRKHREGRNRVEFQDEENRRFIEEYVLPTEQKKLNDIRDNKAMFWLQYSEEEGGSCVQNPNFKA